MNVKKHIKRKAFKSSSRVSMVGPPLGSMQWGMVAQIPSRVASRRKMRKGIGETLGGPQTGMTLTELRQIRKLSQQALAFNMNKKQPNLSKMERNPDMYVSTLRMFIEAMGGHLEIIAQFPEGDVRINQFRDSYNIAIK
jgi:hypothetical protein